MTSALDCPTPRRLAVNNSDASAELAHGVGLMQAPRYRFAEDLAEGRFVETLAGYPPPSTPLFALYPIVRLLDGERDGKIGGRRRTLCSGIAAGHAIDARQGEVHTRRFRFGKIREI